MTSSADTDPDDGLGRLTSAPVAARAPEVVDFDLLGAPAADQVPEVVDFDQLGGAGPDRPAVPLPARAGVDAVLGSPVTATVVEVAQLDESTVTSVTPVVVDVESVGRPAVRGRSGGARSTGAAGPDDEALDADGSDGGGSSGSRRSGTGRSRSSFGDGGSRSFGSRSRGSGSRRAGGGRGPVREWGIQLDAEVEEPVQPSTDAAGVVDESAVPAGRGRGARSAPRGRAGSFGRPRRAEGEPAPEYEDPEQAARQICLTALTGASRTRQQLADLLASRDVPSDAAESVLARFTEVGLIDDAAFAAAWVSSRQSGRGLSRRALADELRRKGVDKEIASVALEAVDPQDEWDTARALIARKVPGMRRVDTATATRRLTALLARKGYSSGLSAWVVREALEADGKAEDAAAEADDAAPDVGAASGGVRRGLWSGRPLDGGPAEAGEVGEGLSEQGRSRTRPPGRLR